MEDNYIPRLFDEMLDFALKTKGAVLVVGPKWCGKTTTTKRHAKTIIDLMPLEGRQDLIDLAKVSPSRFLSAEPKPLLIDEWQHVSFIWDQIKYEVDKTHEFGQFILTGSVTDKENEDKKMEGLIHTGNGRFTKKRMGTLTLYETGESNGAVSLKDLKNGIFNEGVTDKGIDDYAFYICRGGWPLAIGQEEEAALQQARDYHEILVTEDIFSLKSIPLRRDELKARKVIRSYARNTSIMASDETMRADCIAGSEDTFNKDVFAKYLSALRALYVIDEVEAWNPNLRSKTAIRTKSTRHFIDPSIGVAALNLTPEGLFKDMKTFGFFFESLAIHDLRIYAEANNAKLYKYRDGQNREADAVIQFADGSFGLIEIKLGDEEDIDLASKSLRKIAEDVDMEKTGSLAFLMVVTKNKVAKRREDGVYVVPLACLKN